MSELAGRHLSAPEMRRGAVGSGTPQVEKLLSNGESGTTALDWQARRFRKAAEARE
jgi:hypothetical protein